LPAHRMIAVEVITAEVSGRHGGAQMAAQVAIDSTNLLDGCLDALGHRYSRAFRIGRCTSRAAAKTYRTRQMRFERLDFRASLCGTPRVVEALRFFQVLAQLFNAMAVIRPRRRVENLTCASGTIHFRTTGQDQCMNLAVGVSQQLGYVAESPGV